MTKRHEYSKYIELLPIEMTHEDLEDLLIMFRSYVDNINYEELSWNSTQQSVTYKTSVKDIDKILSDRAIDSEFYMLNYYCRSENQSIDLWINTNRAFCKIKSSDEHELDKLQKEISLFFNKRITIFSRLKKFYRNYGEMVNTVSFLGLAAMVLGQSWFDNAFLTQEDAYVLFGILVPLNLPSLFYNYRKTTKPFITIK